MTVVRHRLLIALVIPLLLASTARADEAGPARADAVAEIQKLDGRVLQEKADRERLAEMLYSDMRKRRIAANERETQVWSRIHTREDWERFRDARIAALRQSLGVPIALPANMNVSATGTLRGAGYQIENLFFESRAGLIVTANLYAPAEPRESMPGVVICHSHHSPKTQSELQEMGILWARAGCLVLVMDQLGHGERRAHPFRTAADYDGEFRPGRQDYYFRYNVGMQLAAIGESLIGWMAWDLMRGVDLLLGRPGIHRTRIILLGAVAGGGDPAAVAAALDERIAAAVPFNFGGPQPETTFPLPPDAEKIFNYSGGGSWESTRNLRLSARDGFAPWVIVGSVAPRRLIYAHEFAWDRDHDPVWRRLETLFGFYDSPQNLAETHGRGSVRGQGPENTHCNNIGSEHRVAIHAAFERWFGIPVPKEMEIPRHSSQELTCLTAAAEAQRSIRPVHQVAGELGAQRAAAARARLAQLTPAERREQLRRDWKKLLGDVEPHQTPKVTLTGERGGPILFGSVPAPRFVESTARTPTDAQPAVKFLRDASIERLALEVEPGILVPLVLLTSAKKAEQPRPIVVAVAQHGKQAFLEERAETIVELFSAGIAVCLPDLRGTGETKPDDGRGRNSAATDLSASELMLGQTLVGSRVRDLRSVIRYLGTRPEIDRGRVALWGDSFAAANPRDRNLAVPLDAAQLPPVAEPLGAMAVLLTALFEDDVRAVCARGGLVGFQSLLESPFVYVPHDCIVPGAVSVGDLSEVACALAPRPLLLAELVDGQNRSLTSDEAGVALASVKQAYAGDASALLSLPGPAAASIAAWMQTALKDSK